MLWRHAAAIGRLRFENKGRARASLTPWPDGTRGPRKAVHLASPVYRYKPCRTACFGAAGQPGKGERLCVELQR